MFQTQSTEEHKFLYSFPGWGLICEYCFKYAKNIQGTAGLSLSFYVTASNPVETVPVQIMKE